MSEVATLNPELKHTQYVVVTAADSVFYHKCCLHSVDDPYTKKRS